MTYTPEQIRQMLDAATKGPWLWRVGLRPDCEAYLMGGGGNLVMDFVRRGMQRAIARFNVGGIMHRADEIAVPLKGQEHNAAWNSTLTHPDAVLIQEAPTIIDQLLKENARLRQESAGAIASAYNEGFHAHRCVGGNPLDLFKTSNARRAIGDILEAAQ